MGRVSVSEMFLVTFGRLSCLRFGEKKRLRTAGCHAVIIIERVFYPLALRRVILIQRSTKSKQTDRRPNLLYLRIMYLQLMYNSRNNLIIIDRLSECIATLRKKQSIIYSSQGVAAIFTTSKSIASAVFLEKKVGVFLSLSI